MVFNRHSETKCLVPMIIVSEASRDDDHEPPGRYFIRPTIDGSRFKDSIGDDVGVIFYSQLQEVTPLASAVYRLSALALPQTAYKTIRRVHAP